MTSSSRDHKAGNFWPDFVLVARHHRVLVTRTVLVSALLGVLYSVLVPRYRSTALFMIELIDEKTGQPDRHIDITTNEAYVSTRLSILQSRIMAERVLADLYGSSGVDEARIDRLRQSLHVIRMPLSQLVELRVHWRDAETTVGILNALLKEFQRWSEESSITEASHHDLYLAHALEAAAREVTNAEKDLRDFGVSRDLPIDEEYFQQWTQKAVADERLLESKRLELSQTRDEERAIEALIRERQNGSRSATLTDSSAVAAIRERLEEVELELMKLRETFTDESREVILAKKTRAHLKAELTKTLSSSVFSNVDLAREEYRTIKQRYLDLSLRIAASEASAHALSDRVTKNRVMLTRLSDLRLTADQLRRRLQAGEEVYLDLLKRRQENQADLRPGKPTSIKILSPASAAERTNPILTSAAIGLAGGVTLALLALYVITVLPGRKVFPIRPQEALSPVRRQAERF